MDNVIFSLLADVQVFGEETGNDETAQVFGDDRLDAGAEQAIGVIRATGTQCAATDLAIALGCSVDDAHYLKQAGSLGGNALADRAGEWFLSSAGGYGDVCMVNAAGDRVLSYANAGGSLRPVLRYDARESADHDPAQTSDTDANPAAARSSNADAIENALQKSLPDPDTLGEIRRDICGFFEAEYGEYPQYAADKMTAAALESDYNEGSLPGTGKVYQSLPGNPERREFAYEDRKFVRILYVAGSAQKLSDGKTYEAGDPVWIEVLPVRWLVDEAAGLLVSRSILISGIQFSDSNYYDGDFRQTEACAFLNTSFCADLKPSVRQELTDEERAAREADLQRARQRRNPYDLTFGQVSEEDIIRGAIESDIPVFLHGPSSEGKSARVKQIDPGCEIIYLRNATPDSLNGRSVYNQSTGEMIDIPPTWYKKVKAKCEQEPDTFHVVFFDEINNALPSIQGMAFNIVLDREVNGLWKLPANARVVAAGNDLQDSLAANQIAAPFFNRFAHVYINTTTEKWLRWARENHIHPAIYSYIAYRRGETLRSQYDGEKPNADPRKWEMASKMLYATGRPEMLRALIGEEITDEFVRFCSQPVITLEDVLQGNYNDREIDGMDTAQRYATTMGLTQVDGQQADTVRQFVSRLGEEFLRIFDTLRTPPAGAGR